MTTISQAYKITNLTAKTAWYLLCFGVAAGLIWRFDELPLASVHPVFLWGATSVVVWVLAALYPIAELSQPNNPVGETGQSNNPDWTANVFKAACGSVIAGIFAPFVVVSVYNILVHGL